VKEYWIIRDGNLVSVDLDEPVGARLEITHVVEMAAYRELEAKLARIEIAAEKLKKALDPNIRDSTSYQFNIISGAEDLCALVDKERG
jgi:hypothetical protein